MSTTNRKLYIILQSNLNKGQMLAQTAHAAAFLQRVNRSGYDVAVQPVVVLQVDNIEQLERTYQDLNHALAPYAPVVKFGEPDYGFECETIAALVPDGMKFKNQILGKLKLIQ